MSSKLLRGTFILTLGTILSKILGLFFVIPFKAIIGGETPLGLYNYGYVPYTIFISVATAGVPLAVAKYVAKYNALGAYSVSRKLFKSGLVLMTITGVLSFAVMYGFSPQIASFYLRGTKETGVITVDNITTVMRAVSFALIIIPLMSLIRGYFQGNQSQGPSAVSQVIEQLFRVLTILIGSFIILHWFHGKIVTAISIATFAAFVGGFAGLLVLIWYWVKRKKYMDAQASEDHSNIHVPLSSMYKEIFIYALPFVFVGVANSLYQFVDQLTFVQAMVGEGIKEKVANALFTQLNYTTKQLVNIPTSLAIAFSMTLVPLITANFSKNNFQSMYRQIDQTFQVLLFITVPAAIGMMILAQPLYTVFYGYSHSGGNILAVYAPVAILFALYSVTAAILQGINEQRFTILSLLVGILIKLVLNIPLTKVFHANGTIYATALGYMASIIINLIVIRMFAYYRYKKLIRRTILIGILNVLMGIVVWIFYHFFGLFLSEKGRFSALILIIFCALIGAAIYGVIGLKTGLADLLFGSRIQRIKAKLRL